MVDYNLSGYRDNLVLNIAGLGLSDDENHQSEAGSSWLEDICNSICEIIKPFNASINEDVLFNIKIGRNLQLSIII